MESVGDQATLTAIEGCLLGTAVGDSIGLPFEGLSSRRAQRLFPGALQHRLIFGRGLCSDDTEHACMTAQAVLAAGNDAQKFTNILGWKLRWWLLGLPAGIGLATLRSCLKLWLGFPPSKSGVFSAGNGPAMRSGILGILFGEQPETLKRFVRASTLITHTDPKAEQGAIIVALATFCSSRHCSAFEFKATAFYWKSLGLLNDASLELIENVLAYSEMTSLGFMEDILGLSKGVSGYINHTVPMALHIWLSSPENFEEAITTAVRCGGDTDTLAAIVGAIVGSATGSSQIPEHWMAYLIDYPRSKDWIAQLASCLAARENELGKQVQINPLSVLLRNLVFMVIVLFHGFRRLMPPY